MDKGLYVITVLGPGIDSKFRIDDEDDLKILDLELEKVRNNIHPTKQTIQKGRGDVLNKGLDSVRPVESKTDDYINDVNVGVSE